MCIIFCSLWIYEINDTSDLEELCKINATSALNEFKRFGETGSEGDYRYGVSDFKAFMNSYKYITEDSSTDYIWCNILYGYMIHEPQKVQIRTDQLIKALEYLCEDIYHPQGYHLISVLNNELRYES